MRKKINKNKLDIKKIHRSSSFVVDLNHHIRLKQAEKDKVSYQKKIWLNFFGVVNKIFEYKFRASLKPYFKQSIYFKLKAKFLINSLANFKFHLPLIKVKTPRIRAPKISVVNFEKLKKILLFKFKETAVVCVAAGIYLLAYKSAKFVFHIFFKIGYFTVYFVNFVVILFIRIISLPKVLLDKLFFVNKGSYPLEIDASFQAETPTSPKIIFNFKQSLQKALVLSLFLFILVLPIKLFVYFSSMKLSDLKGRVMGASEIAMSNLMQAGEAASSLKFDDAKTDFLNAKDSFTKIENDLNEINGMFFTLASFYPDANVRMASQGKTLVQIAGQVSSLGASLSDSLNVLFNNNITLPARLTFLQNSLNSIRSEADSINNNLKSLDADKFPVKYRDNFVELRSKMNEFNSNLDAIIDLLDKLKIFLGDTTDKNYLFIFQNNAEMRATGGFIGSYALVELDNGAVEKIEVPTGGGYDTEGLMREIITPPKPLQLITNRWFFWDANWWPDFAKTAEKLMYFYEKSDGPTVDGVISFTPTIFEKLLEIVGPIDMTEKYGVIIDSENFFETTQSIVEQKLTPEEIALGVKHEPKKIIGDMLEIILQRLPQIMNKDNLGKIISLFDDATKQKNILFYFNNETLQAEVVKRNWAGKIKDTSLDYLSVINTNIAGGKSDRKIEEAITLDTEVDENGEIINRLKITRKHMGDKSDLISGMRNVDWMRIYVPQGSELLEAKGFRTPNKKYFDAPEADWDKDADIALEEATETVHKSSGTKVYKENNKTVFANWSMVDSGETAVIYLKYKLPFVLKKNEVKTSKNIIEKIVDLFVDQTKQTSSYSLLVQKQAGAKPSKFNSSLNFPQNSNISWHYGEAMAIEKKSMIVDDSLNSDKYWAVLFND